MKIIDISKHNGIIDFDKVKASGKVDGVMIRSSWGHFREDEQFKRNVSECERLNITYGFYPVFAELNHIPYSTIPLNGKLEINPDDFVGIGSGCH